MTQSRFILANTRGATNRRVRSDWPTRTSRLAACSWLLAICFVMSSQVGAEGDVTRSGDGNFSSSLDRHDLASLQRLSPSSTPLERQFMPHGSDQIPQHALRQPSGSTSVVAADSALESGYSDTTESPQSSALSNVDSYMTSPTDSGMATEAGPLPASTLLDWNSWTQPDRLLGSLRIVAVMGALSLAPALLLMTTCYVRIIIVLSLFRHALGSQQMPPNQVTTTLALFLTLLIMAPVWKQVHDRAIAPYTDPNTDMTLSQAWQEGIIPIRNFMSGQIARYKNHEDVKLFLDYLPKQETPPSTFAEVPLQALLPAFLLSELKVAFLIGFQVYLPFVIVDLVVSSITMSMGMVMVPPTTLALPLKLLMFVLVDGWHLVVEMLLMSFKS